MEVFEEEVFYGAG